MNIPEDLKSTIATVIAETICDDLDRGRNCIEFHDPESIGEFDSMIFRVTKRYDERFLDGETDEPISGDHEYGNYISENVYEFLLSSDGNTLYVREVADDEPLGKARLNAGGLTGRSWGEWTTTDRGLTYKRGQN